MEITTPHGAMDDKFQTHNVEFYHLDAIIAIGYRINSAKATKFRQWATTIGGIKSPRVYRDKQFYPRICLSR